MSQTTIANERQAQLSATVERSPDPGLPRQVLVLRNIGERPVEELVVDATMGGGGAFLAQPNWGNLSFPPGWGRSRCSALFDHRCRLVKFTARYVADGLLTGPILLEATHRSDHSM